MKALVVNTIAKDKSTGKIAYGFFRHLIDKGIDTLLVYGQGNVYREPGLLYIGNLLESKMHIFLSRLLGYPGFFSSISTMVAIKKIKAFRPDIVVLFNIHGYFLNEYKFLNFLGRYGRPVVYVMLDEYPSLGKCGFSMGCDKYKEGCRGCEDIGKYPASWFFNTSSIIAGIKKKTYSKIEKLSFVACEYTKGIAQKSSITVGKRIVMADEAIDLSFYAPRDPQVLKQELGIPKDNKVVVCVAVYPDERKGGQYFLEVVKRFSESDGISFVHVGCSGETTELSGCFTPVSYVEDQEKLCQYYSLGDILCFPSLCETIPSTCIEALACGTPILVFDISGMAYIGDDTCSYVVPPRNTDDMEEVIRKCPRKNAEIIRQCREYAEKRYDNRMYFDKILDTAMEMQ